MEPFAQQLPLDSVNSKPCPVNIPCPLSNRQLFTAKTDGVPLSPNFENLANFLNKTEPKPRFTLQPPSIGHFKFTIWGDEVSALPTPLVRTSVFGVSSQQWKQDEYLTLHPALPDAPFVMSAGPVLNQFDLDIWLSLLRICKQQESPQDFQPVTLTKIQNELGRTRLGGSGRTNIRNRIRRLADFGLFVVYPNAMYLTPLIHISPQADQVSTPSPVIQLVNKQGHTRINLEQRATITTQLQKWLYNFIQAYEEKYQYHLSTLFTLMGKVGGVSKRRKYNFLQEVKRLKELQFITAGGISEAGRVYFKK